MSGEKYIIVTATIAPPTHPADVDGPPVYYMRWMRAISGMPTAQAKELFEKITGWNNYHPSNNDPDSAAKAAFAEGLRKGINDKLRVRPLTVTFPTPLSRMEAYEALHKHGWNVTFKFETCPTAWLG